jgi:hypothetical protein
LPAQEIVSARGAERAAQVTDVYRVYEDDVGLTGDFNFSRPEIELSPRQVQEAAWCAVERNIAQVAWVSSEMASELYLGE